jgi:hypothetical protein
MKEIIQNKLQSKLSGHIALYNNNAWLVSFNTKLGDSIVFNFIGINYYLKNFKKVHILSPFTNILNPERLYLHQSNLSFDWINDDPSANFNSLRERTLAGLSELSKNDFVFVDTGSIGVMILNFFSDKNQSLSHSQKNILFDSYIFNFLQNLRSYFEQKEVFYLFWRNPIDDVTWGRKNFSFAYPGMDSCLPQSLLSDSDPDLLKYIGKEVNVYKISRCIHSFIFGSNFTGELNPGDFKQSTRLNLNKESFVLININTGSLKKRNDFTPIADIFINILSEANKKSHLTFYLFEIEKEWGIEIKEKIDYVLQTSSLKIIKKEEIEDLPQYMINASAIISHCSGFSHLAGIFNKNLYTFSMEESIPFINNRNPWAPHFSFSIKNKSSKEDIELLFQKAIARTKTFE